MRSLKKLTFTNAPLILLGAFFLCNSCKEESKTSSPASDPPPIEVAPEISPAAPPKTTDATSPAAQASPVSTTKPALHPDAVRFIAYNIENYLTMERFVKGGKREKTTKAEEEIAALVDIIVSEKPQILGLCEIGTEEDLADLQARLKAAGLDLPHAVHTGGADYTRHLAILSSLPIASNNSRRKVDYNIGDATRTMSRGILDVVIDLPNGPTHFIGLHLKSKRELKEFDQAEIRLNEARLAREHCDAIFAKNPKARIVLYGDMNDTRKTPPLATLMGKFRTENFMGDVFAKDSRGHLWTHFWSYQQQYARFDWVFVSPSVYPHVDQENSYIADPDNWNEASDHRAVVVTLK